MSLLNCIINIPTNEKKYFEFMFVQMLNWFCPFEKNLYINSLNLTKNNLQLIYP